MKKLLPDMESLITTPVVAVNEKFFNNRSCIIKINTDNKRVDTWIYGVIGKLSDYVKLISILHSLTDKYTVFVHIHSPGGDIRTTCHILTAMDRCKANIITHNIGIAMSCGSFLLSFGDKIAVDDLSITMFHNAICGEKDSLHYLKTKVDHTVILIRHIFDKMIDRGLITETEGMKILNNGCEYFLKSDIITKRLKDNSILYEGVF